jgi:hypothetical protein
VFVSASRRGDRPSRRWLRPTVLALVLGLLAYWLTVGLCALGYAMVPEWVCKGTHLTAPN